MLKKIKNNEKIDIFIVQLFAVYAVTLVASLLVLGTQDITKTGVEENSMLLAVSQVDAKLSQDADSQNLNTMHASKNSSSDQAEDEIEQGSIQTAKSDVIASVTDKDEDTSAEVTNKSVKPLIADNAQRNRKQPSSNIPVNSYVRDVTPPVNANLIASTNIQPFSSANSRSSSVNNISSSSVNNAPISQSSNSQRSSANRARQSTQTQINNLNDPESDGDHAVELLDHGNTQASGSGVTNGTRLDGSVRRECPPLDRFLERDRERVVTIQRSLGCII